MLVFGGVSFTINQINQFVLQHGGKNTPFFLGDWKKRHPRFPSSDFSNVEGCPCFTVGVDTLPIPTRSKRKKTPRHRMTNSVPWAELERTVPPKTHSQKAGETSPFPFFVSFRFRRIFWGEACSFFFFEGGGVYLKCLFRTGRWAN